MVNWLNVLRSILYDHIQIMRNQQGSRKTYLYIHIYVFFIGGNPRSPQGRGDNGLTILMRREVLIAEILTVNYDISKRCLHLVVF